MHIYHYEYRNMLKACKELWANTKRYMYPFMMPSVCDYYDKSKQYVAKWINAPVDKKWADTILPRDNDSTYVFFGYLAHFLFLSWIISWTTTDDPRCN